MKQLRLADPIAGLSVAGDLGMGREPGHAMRACLLATRLAWVLEAGPSTASAAFYTALLRNAGCMAPAHEVSQLIGDEIAAGGAAERSWFGAGHSAAGLMRSIARDAGPLERLRVGSAALVRGRSVSRLVARASSEAAAITARRIGLDPGIEGSLAASFDWWNEAGDRIPIAARIAQVASAATLFASSSGPGAAVEAVRSGSGTVFDPQVADAFIRRGRDLLGDIEPKDAHDAVLAAEPDPVRTIPEGSLDEISRAFGDLVDLKSPYAQGHSSSVAALAWDAAGALGLDGVAVRRAGWLQDVGRAPVSNRIWDKKGPLTSREWEQVRLHPYHGERMLARSQALAALAPIVGHHHERQDGSGYHRGAPGTVIPVEACVLSAADTFCAMTEHRAYRPAHSVEKTAALLDAAGADGIFHRDAVRAVLDAAGARLSRPKRVAPPPGLSDRQAEVLPLAARGLSSKQIARRLRISAHDAGEDVQHLCDVVRSSSRSALALFAMQHDLMRP